MLDFIKSINLKSIGYLLFIQIGNVLIPFLLIPLLARELGPELIGEYVFLQIVSLIIYTITEFAAEFSGVKKLAQAVTRGEKEIIVSQFQNCKLFFGGGAVIVFLLVSPIFIKVDELILASLFVGLVQGLSYNWVFLSFGVVERIALFEFFSKLISSVLIVYFAVTNKDLLSMLAVSFALYVVQWLYGYIYLLKRMNIGLARVCSPLLLLSSTWPIFLYKIVFSFSIVIVSIFVKRELGAVFAGYFINCERLVRVCRSLLHPFSRVLFASISKVSSEVEYSKFYSSSFLLVSTLAVIFGVLLTAFSYPIILLLFGSEYMEMVSLLKVMSVLVPLVMINNNLVLNFYIARSNERYLALVLTFTMVFSLLISFFMIPGGTHFSAAYSYVLIEVFLLVLLFVTKKYVERVRATNKFERIK